MLTSSKSPFKILTPLKSSKSHLNAKFYQHPPFRRSKAVSNIKLATNIATKASAVTESHSSSTSTSTSSSRSTSSSHSHKLQSAPSKRLRSTVGKVFIVLAGVIFVASLAMNAALSYFQLYFNVSESLPYGLYKITYIHKPGLNPFAFSDNRDAMQYGSAVVATDKSNTAAADSRDTAATDGNDIAALADSSGMGESAMAERDAKRGSDYSLERGMLVLACLPDEVAKLAYERHYIASGKCKGGYAPVGKYIQAVTGDEVRFTSEGIIVNGSLLENSKPYAMDGEGRPMPVMLQDMVLPKDEFVLLNNYAGSFDSRYYGPIPSRYVVGTLKPVLTF